MKKILFSPVGGTDPISNCRDGAMLHICRVYKPDIVYLYLSREMVEFHRQNNRYMYCIERLGEMLYHEFEVELIERENLKEVQIFDPFIEEYQDILRYILKKHGDCELYLNVSSGTPAMKSALQILGAMSEGKMQMIQVSTPERKINPHLESHTDYDVELYWECNDDNTDFKNRCIESKANNLLDEVRIQSIIRHVKAYDYTAALSEGKQLAGPLPEKAQAYLEAANCRTQLDLYGLRSRIKKEEVESVLPIRNEKYCNIFEYILNLQIKVKKEEYVDFIRGITPVLVDLFQIALKEEGGIDYRDYIFVDNRGTEKWDVDKIKANGRMDQAFKNAFGLYYTAALVYSSNLLPCIQEFCTENQEIVKLSEELRDVEKSIRNLAAHEIVSVTRNTIKKKTGFLPEEILGKLKRYAQILPLGVKTEYWDSYDKMNAMIIEQVKRR